ncbi:MAG TPA: reverse transcriptase domain-containing protein [Gemmataceae bacterium]
MSLFDRLLEILGLNKPDEPRKKPKPQAAAPAPPAGQPEQPAVPSGPKPAQTLNLEASDLLPITSEELRASLQQLIRSGQWRFTFRGTIPLGDERTRLINRALLTNGFLTPEQLDEIIQTAMDFERMEKAKAVLEAKAQKAGEAAVKADKEARARLKEQKKAEAAERKRKHAEGVAHRRATDIIFLGTGVSYRLNDRTSDADKLAGFGLPVLATPGDVANALGVTVPQLRWLAFHTNVATRLHYVHFEVPKRSGGTRVLSAPHKKLAAAQEWVLREILNKLPVTDPAHGFVKGRSILTNARPHAGKAVILNMDLEGFFPSISWVRVRALFQRLGYSGAVATVLALLCTECPREAVEYAGKIYYVAVGQRGLPQGACTSPALSNQIARRLDKRLDGLARKLGLTCTRYADDITFSGPAEFNGKVGYVMARVRHIAAEEGFAVNEKKSRVLRPNAAQFVTGLVVNVRPSVPRAEIRRLRAILHQAEKAGLDAQNREGRANFRGWLHGKLAYLKMVRPEVGTKMMEQYLRLAGQR